MKKQMIIGLFSIALVMPFIAAAVTSIEEGWEVLEAKPQVSDAAYAKFGISKNASAFDILGVKVTTPKDEIRKKYVSLIEKWHPDKHGNAPYATEITQLLTWAYHQIK